MEAQLDRDRVWDRPTKPFKQSAEERGVFQRLGGNPDADILLGDNFIANIFVNLHHDNRRNRQNRQQDEANNHGSGFAGHLEITQRIHFFVLSLECCW